MARAGLALGSNLGDCAANLRAAIAELREISVPDEPVLLAPIYQTTPEFCPPDSPDFLNSVMEIEFVGSAAELLEKTQALEKKLGRQPSAERNAPRVIDIDILYLGEEQIADGPPELPHPRLCERLFVLQPLADIRPDFILPGQSETVAQLVEKAGILYNDALVPYR